VGLLTALLLFAAFAAGVFVYKSWWGSGPSHSASIVKIESGSTLRAAARQLEKADVLCCSGRFYRLARLFGSDDPIQAGEFEFPEGVSPARVLDILQHGKPVQRLITIPEGMPAILVYERLIAEPLLTGAIPVPAEGSVLPDSYSFERGETRALVLKRMQDAMTAALDAAWKQRTAASAVRTKREAVVLASIVEKETGVPAERPQVAAVYTNRLKQGMRLQADPTTIYPITKGKPLGRRIRRSELDAVNGYNTYAIAGLPQGPIANPGRDSILAVLAPPQSKALYFVANGKGGHVFSETLAQHEANVARYYAIRRQRGEM
jgi:UPF0755 protein